MSINRGQKARCSSLHLFSSKELLLVSQHALAPGRQRLRHLARKGAHLLVLHEVLVHQVTQAQADRQIAGEEGVGHRLTPQLLGDRLMPR